MATASVPAAAPSAISRVPLAQRLLPAAATVVGVAVLLRLVYDQYLNYDARYALLWARDLARGLKPDYEADFAPTPHPLETAVSVLATPFGDGADVLLIWVILLCFGLLVWLTYRLGAELFSPWVGVVAALVVLTRPALERDALLGYQDTAFAVLVVGAALLETQRPRRGGAVLGLLAVAGLMRPEAWVLAGLYWLYLWPVSDRDRRIRLAGVVALAPLLWVALDWYVTGDPLHSLHGTADLAEAVDRRRSPEQAPYWTVQYFGYVLREPVVAGLPIGLYFAWRHRLHAAVLPLAIAAAMTAVFMIGPVFGLPLIGRYVRTPSVFLALFYGLAVCGWLLLAPGRVRRIWMWVGIGTAALSVAFLPWHVGMLGDMRDNLDARARGYEQLRAVARAPGVAAAVRRCGDLVTAGEHRAMPHLRWWLDTPPFSLGTVEAGASPLRRVLVTPRDNRVMRRFYRDQFPEVDPPPGYRRVARNGAWRVDAAPECVRPG
ncbi:MAG TPA: hypothetical protein VK631_02240 [Solirubrobacteraceae bacterium]|nr:hypothetical protein [Solirubrobacteraceae bacterium]